MDEHEGLSLPKREMTGPLFLVVLLAAAFIPSVFISFDLSQLRIALSRAAGARRDPPTLVSVRADEDATCLDCESCAGYSPSEEADSGHASRGIHSRSVSAAGPGEAEPPLPWPRDARPSPRAPPFPC